MIYFIIAFLIVLADQVTKYLITLQLGTGGTIELFPEVLRLTYVENRGAAFSMLSNYTFYLAIASAVVCVGLIVMIIACRWGGFGKLSLAFILGGAVGNLIDRFVMGYVVDMIEPTFVRFAVFNVADIFVTVGAIFLIFFILFGNKKVEPTTAAERKEKKFKKKYGPDVDEAELAAMDAEAAPAAAPVPVSEEPAADLMDVPVTEDGSTMIFRGSEPAKAETPLSDESASAQTDGDEFSLEDILKEYGHDF